MDCGFTDLLQIWEQLLGQDQVIVEDGTVFFEICMCPSGKAVPFNGFSIGKSDIWDVVIAATSIGQILSHDNTSNHSMSFPDIVAQDL